MVLGGVSFTLQPGLATTPTTVTLNKDNKYAIICKATLATPIKALTSTVWIANSGNFTLTMTAINHPFSPKVKVASFLVGLDSAGNILQLVPSSQFMLASNLATFSSSTSSSNTVQHASSNLQSYASAMPLKPGSTIVGLAVAISVFAFSEGSTIPPNNETVWDLPSFANFSMQLASSSILFTQNYQNNGTEARHYAELPAIQVGSPYLRYTGLT